MTLTAQQEMRLIGHSLVDYQRMFDLSGPDLKKSILDYMAGASSFNAQMQARGASVVSCDGLYGLSMPDLAERVDTVLQKMTEVLTRHPDQFNGQVSDWIQKKKIIVEQFISDFQDGYLQQRYQLPPIIDKTRLQTPVFNMGLCSHYLFNKPKLSLDECLQTIQFLCRIAEEIRIFPLLDDTGQLSPLLGPLMLDLQSRDYGVEIRQVDFEFQQGGNAMLRVWAQTCQQ